MRIGYTGAAWQRNQATVESRSWVDVAALPRP